MSKVTCFSVHDFEREYLEKYAKNFHLDFELKEHFLDKDTAAMAQGSKAVSCFANDKINAQCLIALKEIGVEMISLRSAGYSHLDIIKAKELGMTITRVPSYSPEAIAEHAVGLLMCLNRKYIKASQRIRELNFTLNGLQGYTLAGKTVGVIGAGHIGICFIKIMLGMGCKVLVYDLNANPEVEKLPNCQYTDLDTLLINSDVVSLHCPLNESTKHIINKDSLEKMKDTAYLINTGRGGLINTTDLIQIIKAKKIGGVGLDVYEYEENIFFHDLSDQGLSDDTLARLLTFPNVIITSHQAFFTYEALNNIAKNSMQNVAAFLSKQVIDPLYVILPIS